MTKLPKFSEGETDVAPDGRNDNEFMAGGIQLDHGNKS